MSIRSNAMNPGQEAHVHEEPQMLATVLAHLRNDLKEFFQARFQLLVAELRQKVAAWKTGALRLAIALIFAAAAFLLLTGALVAIIAASIGAFFALLIVGVLYLAIAGGATWFGYRELTSQRLPPDKTLQVLKEDQAWLQNEAKSA